VAEPATGPAAGVKKGWLAITILSVAACAVYENPKSSSPPIGLTYPAAEAGPQVDTYHGVEIADPYRWMENPQSEQIQQWVAAQNDLASPYLESLPSRAAFAERLAELINYERFGVPGQRAGRYIYTHNTGLQDQDTIWMTDDPLERGVMLLDPNRFSADGTVSISTGQLSPDGNLLAYSVSAGGSDWRSWHIFDIESGRSRPDELRGIKFSGLSWSKDGAGVFYSRYPRMEGDDQYDDQRQVSVWYHLLGTDQAEDREIYRVPDHATRSPYASVTDDGAYLVLNIFDGYRSSGFYYQQLGGGNVDPEAPTVRLLDEWDGLYEFLGNDGATFYFKTTRAAPAGQVVAIDLANPDPGAWRTIVAESAQVIEAASLVGRRIIVQSVVDAHAKVELFNLAGDFIREIPLPGLGTVAGFAGRIHDHETFFAYTDFSTPSSVYRFDVDDGSITPVHIPVISLDTSVYITKQVFFTSADGTQVPMYLVHRRDLILNGRQPTVLYGYGGFNISLLPRYSTTTMAWLDAGGVFASANLRGGGEYGERWHEAGTVLNKQNVFDDFIAAAQWLIDNDYTRPENLAITGRSNGGLLVGAVMLQRPDLFAAAVPGVGVLDMLRYHTASANARQWSTDYGLSENPDEFAAQLAYSPVHNVRQGRCYPATLIIADENDDRVVPWHSYKFAAALQAAQACEQPALIRIETRSGHGAGASTSKIVEAYADQWAFVAEQIGLARDVEQ
jgi:prolyl oligopeptidase